MPTNRTRSPGAITSRRPLPSEASSCARLGGATEPLDGPDDVAAGLAVLLELDEAFFFRIFEQVRECLVAVVGLVEARIAALERLLHHRAPDLLVGAALGDERLESAEHLVVSLLLLFFSRRGRVLAFL